jgi:disulfide bond formation protein DsbB
MSYAIAPTFESNRIGVRVLSVKSGLGGVPSGWNLGGLGTAPDQDTINELVAAGYDPGTISTLALLGATDEQLLALPYPADSGTMAAAAANLMNQLGGATAAPGAPASSAGSYPQSAQPTTVSSAWGTYDLTQEASWNAISSLFSQVQQLLNQTAQLAPKDSDTIANVTQFNSLVVQWAGYYQRAFGNSPSSLPMASIPSGLGALGVIPVVIVVGLIAGVAALLAALYGIYQWAQTKQAQIRANQQNQSQAVSGAQAQANNLLQQAQALQASNPTLAAQLRTQAASLLGQALTTTNPNPPQPPGALTSWFTQNWSAVAAVVALLVLAPPLIKKL